MGATPTAATVIINLACEEKPDAAAVCSVFWRPQDGYVLSHVDARPTSETPPGPVRARDGPLGR